MSPQVADDKQNESITATIRSLNQFEAEQVDRRLNWHGTLQGLLFTALAFGWDKNIKLSKLIAALGFASALLIFVGLITSAIGIWKLHKLWRKTRPSRNHGTVEVFSNFPERAPWLTFVSPSILLPVVFALAWTGIYAILTEVSPAQTTPPSATANASAIPTNGVAHP